MPLLGAAGNLLYDKLENRMGPMGTLPGFPLFGFIPYDTPFSSFLFDRQICPEPVRTGEDAARNMISLSLFI